MSWKDRVPITQQMYNTSKVGIVIGRLLGLFPLDVVKNGSQLYLKLSPLYMLYSYLLGILLPVLAYRGLIIDIHHDKATSIKIKSRTDMYVAICDISVLEFAALFGIFVNTLGSSSFMKFLKCLNEVDSIIPPKDIKKSKNLSIFVMVATIIATASITAADLLMYFKLSGEIVGKAVIMECWMAFYVTYYVVLLNQYKFWHLGYSILRRLRRLNEELEMYCFDKEYVGQPIKLYSCSPKVQEINLALKDVGYVIDTLNPDKSQKFVFPRSNYLNKKSTHIQYLFKLMTVYETLCDAAEILNDLYGFNNAIIIIGILWHMIETPYLLILEIVGNRKDTMYITVLSSWCFLHIGRLMLLAQPCHSCLLEAERTQEVVCKLLFSADIEAPLKSQLQDFSFVLLHRKFEFTASGLTTIDRSLVTSIMGAITTYLVILLQYAKSEQV